MSFGGAVSAMIASIKSNARGKRKTFFDRKHTYKKRVAEDKLLQKKASPKQLQQIRKKLAKQNKRERTKTILVIIITILLFTLLFFFLLKKSIIKV
ncbi:hypothetical protein N9V96_00195 [Polaribacter sp.]|nr:hypothetical protein [Polaribacter sp.]